MADIQTKLKAALTKDQQIILKSFHIYPDRTSWDNSVKSRVESQIVHESLLEAGLTEEAAYFLKVASDCLGDLYSPNAIADQSYDYFSESIDYEKYALLRERFINGTRTDTQT